MTLDFFHLAKDQQIVMGDAFRLQKLVVRHAASEGEGEAEAVKCAQSHVLVPQSKAEFVEALLDEDELQRAKDRDDLLAVEDKLAELQKKKAGLGLELPDCGATGQDLCLANGTYLIRKGKVFPRLEIAELRDEGEEEVLLHLIFLCERSLPRDEREVDRAA